jgi:hypothetical protein
VSPTLGVLLRATRLGYRQVPGRPFFLRMRRGLTPDTFRLDFSPLTESVPMQLGRRANETHFCWWEAPAEASVLDVVPISCIKTVKRPFTLTCADDGRVIS